MSIKSFIQILILLLILIIIGGVYIKYFDTKKNLIEEVNISDQIKSEELEKLEEKILDLEEKNKELSEKIENNEISTIEKLKVIENNNIEKNIINKKENLEEIKNKKVNKDIQDKKNKKIIKKEAKTKNLVKNLEYTSVDQRGNKFHLIATSGKTNENEKDILDLENVKGKITSDKRDTINIVSDFAQYNSLNLNSKFYQNVIINYQDKEITCINFDINMDTNKAIAYENVVITDPPRAGMHKDVVQQILNMAPKRVVYISCNPATQARDVDLMREYYDVTLVQPVDMFPHTHHVENIMVLKLK